MKLTNPPPFPGRRDQWGEGKKEVGDNHSAPITAEWAHHKKCQNLPCPLCREIIRERVPRLTPAADFYGQAALGPTETGRRLPIISGGAYGTQPNLVSFCANDL